MVIIARLFLDGKIKNWFKFKVKIFKSSYFESKNANKDI